MRWWNALATALQHNSEYLWFKSNLTFFVFEIFENFDLNRIWTSDLQMQMLLFYPLGHGALAVLIICDFSLVKLKHDEYKENKIDQNWSNQNFGQPIGFDQNFGRPILVDQIFGSTKVSRPILAFLVDQFWFDSQH